LQSLQENNLKYIGVHMKKCYTVVTNAIIALWQNDITIKTFIKILLFNTRDHGHLEGTKQRKYTENHTKNHIKSQREMG